MFIPGPISMCIGRDDEVDVDIESIECPMAMVIEAIEVVIEAIEDIDIEDIEFMFILMVSSNEVVRWSTMEQNQTN